MPDDQKTPPPAINQTAIGDGNVQVAGDNNTVNIFQKVFKGINIVINKVIRGDSETLGQRNRRILLNHVENFWVKGVLEKSLYGEVLIELGMKEEPEAVKTYPWGIKRENTGETLPAGMTMLEIFEQVGLGRALLILGAPGSGKTTMLLELARQLIERSRKDETEPIPMVFNLASWTEKQTLAQWLAEQLNLIYYVPKRLAPDWVSGNKLLFLLDGMDEVRKENRDGCVEAINRFRIQNGLTSLVICSRNQDYTELKVKLSCAGAVELQPLSRDQIETHIKKFSSEMSEVLRVINADNFMLEIAKTPLFLNILILTFRGRSLEKQTISDIEPIDIYRRYLLDAYIQYMFVRSGKNGYQGFSSALTTQYLSWLANQMILHNKTTFFVHELTANWLGSTFRKIVYISIGSVIAGVAIGLLVGGILGINTILISGSVGALVWAITLFTDQNFQAESTIPVIPSLTGSIIFGLYFFSQHGILLGILGVLLGGLVGSFVVGALLLMIGGAVFVIGAIIMFLIKQKNETANDDNPLFITLISTIVTAFVAGFLGGVATIAMGIRYGMAWSLMGSIQGYLGRLILWISKKIPYKLIPFLDHCVDLIFLRRVGGGYIFVHRLLMEHFAEMYTEKYAPKESQ